jgi:hypothetical protein
MKLLGEDRPLPGMARMAREAMQQPPQPVGQPIDLGFFISTHQYLRSISDPSEPIQKAIKHLEEQISNALCSINFGIRPAP